ncbi:MAG: thrombospondin type 3 repeat-containing protein [Candidatus Andersenbacteria bacterium]
MLAFLLGRQTFSALHDVNDPAGAAARLLPQDSVASIATQDSDKDGLTDLEEVRYHTDPHNADSDHDGYPDGVEVQNGYDPTAAPGKGVDQSKPAAASAGDSSLLSSLGLSPVSSKVDGLNVGVGGIGGVGGVSTDSLQQLAGQSVSSTQRVADLEVDKLLTSSSTPLPVVDSKTVKVQKGADRSDVERTCSGGALRSSHGTTRFHWLQDRHAARRRRCRQPCAAPQKLKVSLGHRRQLGSAGVPEQR